MHDGLFLLISVSESLGGRRHTALAHGTSFKPKDFIDSKMAINYGYRMKGITPDPTLYGDVVTGNGGWVRGTYPSNNKIRIEDIWDL